MWGFVRFPESNDYCVLKSTQVHEGNFAVGETVSVLYKAKILFVSSSRSLCEKECKKVVKNLGCRKELSTDLNDSLEIDEMLQSEKPPRSTSPNFQHSSTPDNSTDSIHNEINQLSNFVHSQMDNIREDLIQLNARSSMANLKLEKMDRSLYTVKSSLNEIMDRVPPIDSQKVLTYPYRLTKNRADDIQKSSPTMTHFARVAERQLFADEEDKHTNISERISQDKARWLREMIKFRYPTQTQGSEPYAWSACVNLNKTNPNIWIQKDMNKEIKYTRKK
ncbi:hypothetical protein OESDEN_06112 [Oesophagostomum dentatum]|uniref:Uncharacterized protein n=1 Tax=Oesophagostomum dentatum TaxID=61180 RepID=A0A0B1T9P8_OESDE|nr:hypothetical protein OESDEN_06112 [Oesophagostomum dentatum]